MTKFITSIIALALFVLASVLAEGNRIDRRIVHIEIEHNRQLREHNRLLQEQNIELQVRTAALSEISRSIDQATIVPIPQRN